MKIFISTIRGRVRWSEVWKCVFENTLIETWSDVGKIKDSKNHGDTKTARERQIDPVLECFGCIFLQNGDWQSWCAFRCRHFLKTTTNHYASQTPGLKHSGQWFAKVAEFGDEVEFCLKNYLPCLLDCFLGHLNMFDRFGLRALFGSFFRSISVGLKWRRLLRSNFRCNSNWRLLSTAARFENLFRCSGSKGGKKRWKRLQRRRRSFFKENKWKCFAYGLLL